MKWPKNGHSGAVKEMRLPFNGPDRDRTGDLLTASQARSQLRYRPLVNSNIVKERVGRVNRRYCRT